MSAKYHEGIANGANEEWKYYLRIENENKPEFWEYIGLWGQIYLEEGYDYPKNTGIHIYDFKMYGYKNVSQMVVKLVRWDYDEIDDIDSAHFVANVGGDWWRENDTIWSNDWSNNKGIAQGQFRKITKEEKICYATNIPKGKYLELMKNKK